MGLCDAVGLDPSLGVVGAIAGGLPQRYGGGIKDGGVWGGPGGVLIVGGDHNVGGSGGGSLGRGSICGGLGGSLGGPGGGEPQCGGVWEGVKGGGPPYVGFWVS